MDEKKALEAAVLAAPGKTAEECKAIAEPIVLAYLQALSPGSTGWRDIESAPKDKGILGWGRLVGKNLCRWNADLKQWVKVEASARYQLGPSAITHWLPHDEPPSAMLSAAGEL